MELSPSFLDPIFQPLHEPGSSFVTKIWITCSSRRISVRVDCVNGCGSVPPSIRLAEMEWPHPPLIVNSQVLAEVRNRRICSRVMGYTSLAYGVSSALDMRMHTYRSTTRHDGIRKLIISHRTMSFNREMSSYRKATLCTHCSLELKIVKPPAVYSVTI